MLFRISEENRSSCAKKVPLVQAILETLTGRNLDPVEVTYTTESVHVGHGYHQSIHVRSQRNLRSGVTTVDRTKGGVA